MNGSDTATFASANSLTEALTKKAMDDAHTDVKTTARRKKKYFVSVIWKPEIGGQYEKVWQLSEVQPNVATEATLQTKYFMYNTSDDLILSFVC